MIRSAVAPHYNSRLSCEVTSDRFKYNPPFLSVAMRLIERTHDPSIASVNPDDLTHGPDPDDVDGDLTLDDLGGKDLRAVLRFEQGEARVRAKQLLHVVTDDGDTYEWSRFGDGERWTFERRVTDGGLDMVTHQLPACVEAIVEERGLLY